MGAVNSLNSTDKIQGGDSFAINSVNAGDDRKVNYSTLLAQLQQDLNFGDPKSKFIKQFSTPISGSTVLITDGNENDSNIWLIITPAATLPELTIKLPPIADVVDLQEVLILTTQELTLLTLDANGATSIVGDLSTLPQNGFLKLKFESQTKNWYRVG